MPKSKSRSKSRKGAGRASKKKKKAPPKMSKKMKKLVKKFGQLMYDGKSIATQPRDEIEFVAENLMEEVTLKRSERIRYQLERDFLYDLVSLDLARNKELQLRKEAELAMALKLKQDAEEMAIVKGQEGKHFRYEMMLKRGRMDMSDELRRQDLLSHADAIWQNACLSIDQQSEIMYKRLAPFENAITDTKASLDDLDDRVLEFKQQMISFTKEIYKHVQQALKDCKTIAKIDSLETEQVWSEVLFASSRLNSIMFETMQNYYNDITTNNLNVILTVRDRFEELSQQNKDMAAEIEQYNEAIQKAAKLYRKVKAYHKIAKSRHEYLLRLQRGHKFTEKNILEIEAQISMVTSVQEQLVRELENVSCLQDFYKSNIRRNNAEVAQSFSKRLNLEKAFAEKAASERDLRNVESGLINAAGGPESYHTKTMPYRQQVLCESITLDKYRRSIHIERVPFM